MDIHLTKQDIVDLVRLASPYIHVVELAGVYYIACEKPNVDYSCQEVYEVILTWVIQVNNESIDFRCNPLWFGYVPEETVRKLHEDLMRRNRLIGEVKQKLIAEGKCNGTDVIRGHRMTDTEALLTRFPKSPVLVGVDVGILPDQTAPQCEYTLVVPPPLPDEYLRKAMEQAKAKPIVQYEIPLEGDFNDTD